MKSSRSGGDVETVRELVEEATSKGYRSANIDEAVKMVAKQVVLRSSPAQAFLDRKRVEGRNTHLRQGQEETIRVTPDTQRRLTRACHVCIGHPAPVNCVQLIGQQTIAVG